MKQIERLLNMTEEERRTEFSEKGYYSYGEFFTEEECRAINCLICSIRLKYLNSEVPKNALEEIGAGRMEKDTDTGNEEWELATENNDIVYIAINLKTKTFDVTGYGTVEVAKAITKYLETL